MKIVKTLALVFLVTSLVSCNSKEFNKKSLKTEIDSVSYALGVNMASQFKENFKEINRNVFVQGYLNGMDSLSLLLINEKDVNTVLSTFFKKKQQAQAKIEQEKAAKIAEVEFRQVKEEGERFLAENKTKKGVKITASGLQYIVLKEGKGAKPTATSQVKVYYKGTLTDGTVFDSSGEKNVPYITYVNRVIEGWIEGLQLMNVGSKYRFFIPQELAYGATPRPGVIKPFMPLIFEVELVEIIQEIKTKQ
jgi:FKBP-type peptidyl-prolyl cis-trans isomerase